MHILDSIEFFVKTHLNLKQTFKNSSRWKIDKIHHKTGIPIPLKESHENTIISQLVSKNNNDLSSVLIIIIV
jgi:hypothetical protein